MALMDPVAVNKQIDAFLASVPPGKRAVLLGQASLSERRLGASLVVRVTDNIGAYVRVGKTQGQKMDAEAGVKATFLIGPQGSPEKLRYLMGTDPFTYAEIVDIFRARGFNWVRSHLYAYRLMRGGEVEL